jgi:uroporphyrinogen decarboxylase
MFHSCGAVAPLINDFVVTGFDALNPLQPRAAGMEPAVLKREYGDRMSFLGGIDVQQTLRGSREGVRDEVCHRIRHYGPGGGYILAPSHNLFDDVPLGNVLCMLETAREFGAYPIRA